MKTMILVATAVFGLSFGYAYANGEGDSTGQTFFTQLPGEEPLAAGEPSNAAIQAQDNAASANYMASHNATESTVPHYVSQGS